MFLNSEVINEIAAELAIAPAFVEKDWYSVQVLKAISSYQSETITTIFSGGTSLSKGHGLLKRFSEDLDFRCQYQKDGTGNQQRKVRSVYRESIVSSIHAINTVQLDETLITKASNHFKFPLSYSQVYEEHSALRAKLEVEFSFTQPHLNPETKPIQSLISQFTAAEPEATILCLSPLEIAADKLSALTWRVIKRDRSSSKDDPAMVRHLHDLCALSSVIDAEQDLFMSTALASFEEDQLSGRRATSKGLYESLTSALVMLKKDDEYKKEYGQFVDAMSYADDEENITFEAALSNLERQIVLFEQSS